MSQQKLSRRDLLKLLAASAGAAALSTVPTKWVTPIVEVGALPAHAQASLRGSIQVTITEGSFGPKKAKPNFCGPTWKVQIKNGTTVVTTVDVLPDNGNPWSVTIGNLPAGTYTVNLLDHCWCFNDDSVWDFKSNIGVTPPGTTQVSFIVGGC